MVLVEGTSTPNLARYPSTSGMVRPPARSIGDTTVRVMGSESALGPDPLTSSAARPGRRRKQDLALSEVVRPHDHLFFLLPLEGDHLVSELDAVRVDLELAERCPQIELENVLADLVGVEASCALDALRVDEAPRVPRRGEVGRLALELGPVALDELSVARVIERGLPLGGAVDVLGVALERVVELRQVAADRDAVQLRVDVELPHLTGQRDRIVEVRGRGQHVGIDSLDLGERSEEHTSELQSLAYLVCRLLLEKKKKKRSVYHILIPAE